MNSPHPPPYYVCPNGHGAPPPPLNGYCNLCGAALVAVAPGPPPPAPNNRPGPVPPYAPPPPNGHWQNPPPPPQWNNQPPPPAYGPPYGAPPMNYPPPNAPYQPYPQPPYPPQGQWPQQGPPVIGGGPVPVQVCSYCGGEGRTLDPSVVVCPQCRWLRPLAPGYVVHPNAFQWGADSQAMAKLRSIGPLQSAARAVSDKVGRRWVETSFNAVRLGENQLPHIYGTAVRAGRLLGMPYMPDVYVSGDKAWESLTYGSDRSSFIIMGSSLVNNFKDDDLLFLFGREMGHCRAGHALWKTVGMFLFGQQSHRKGMMAEGVLGALNVEHLLQSAIDVPFLSWARLAEITGDRAGMLAVGNEETARRVLLAWSLRSVPLYEQINVDAWLQQQEDSDDQVTRIAEMISSPTPYITRRLKQLTVFARSPELYNMRVSIGPLDQAAYPATPDALTQPAEATEFQTPAVEVGTFETVDTALPDDDVQAAPDPTVAVDVVRIKCASCGAGMRVPREKLEGKTEFKVRCPNTTCGIVMTLRKKSSTTQEPSMDAPTTAPAAGERIEQ